MSTNDLVFLTVLFALSTSMGLFLLFRPRTYQKFLSGLFAGSPNAARFIPFKGYMGSPVYVVVLRVAGVGCLIVSVVCLLGIMGAVTN